MIRKSNVLEISNSLLQDEEHLEWVKYVVQSYLMCLIDARVERRRAAAIS